jgi:hypothetical protein
LSHASAETSIVLNLSGSLIQVSLFATAEDYIGAIFSKTISNGQPNSRADPDGKSNYTLERTISNPYFPLLEKK